MSTAGKIKEEPKQEFQPVLCDMCVDTQVPALKTCLKCEISMCAQHLQAHLTTPVLLQTHPLTKPTTPGGLSSGAVRCPEHGKLLEYYCLDDRTCVCVSCSIEDQHRLHNMKSLPSAHKVLVEKLREELKDLDEREKQAKALKSWETKQTKALQVSTEYLVKSVSSLRDIGLNKVQSSVTARLGAIQTARQNIEAALSEEDAHMFLQRFAGVHEAVEKARAVDFIHGLEEERPAKVVFDILKNGHQVMEKVRKLQRDLLVVVDPDKLYWGESKPANVTFDPKTLGEHFLVSSDLKMLVCRPPIQHVSQTVFLQKSTTDSDLHWTIEFSEKYDWSVGISDRGYFSHGNNLNGPLYGLEWRDKRFLALHTKAIKKKGGMKVESYSIQCDIINYPSKSSTSFDGKKIEVHLDHSNQLLSFFIRCEYEVICLHRVEIGRFFVLSSALPFVKLEKREKENSCGASRLGQSYPSGKSSCGNIRCDNSQISPYVDFVCALDDENLQTVYSRGKKSTP